MATPAYDCEQQYFYFFWQRQTQARTLPRGGSLIALVAFAVYHARQYNERHEIRRQQRKAARNRQKKGGHTTLTKGFFSYKYTCFFFSISSELSCKPQQAHEIPNTLHARYETSCRVPLTTNHGNALHTAVRRMRTAWLICSNVKKRLAATHIA